MARNYRRCVSCRKLAHKSEFWRIVRIHPDKKIHLDQGMGRSAYLCPKQECLIKARQKKLLERSLRTKVDYSVYDVLAGRLTS